MQVLTRTWQVGKLSMQVLHLEGEVDRDEWQAAGEAHRAVDNSPWRGCLQPSPLLNLTEAHSLSRLLEAHPWIIISFFKHIFSKYDCCSYNAYRQMQLQLIVTVHVERVCTAMQICCISCC